MPAMSESIVVASSATWEVVRSLVTIDPRYTVVVDDAYPLGTVTFWEPENYARMQELRDGDECNP